MSYTIDLFEGLEVVSNSGKLIESEGAAIIMDGPCAAVATKPTRSIRTLKTHSTFIDDSSLDR